MSRKADEGLALFFAGSVFVCAMEACTTKAQCDRLAGGIRRSDELARWPALRAKFLHHLKTHKRRMKR